MATLQLPSFYSPPSFTRKSLKSTIFSASSLSLCPSSPSPPSLHLPIEARRTHLSAISSLAPSSTSAPSAATVENPPPDSEVADETCRSKLCAQNVPWTFTADDVRSLFQKHGNVLDVELSMHNKSRNRGLAFITMGSPEEALAALTNLESADVGGRILKVNYAKTRKKKLPPAKPVPSHDLFVGNLSFKARDQDLREFFNAGNGNVVSAEVVYRTNPEKPAGYGYVSFKSRVEAEAALSAFQGKMLMGRPIRLEPTRRLPKQESSEDASEKLDAEVKLPDKVDTA